MLPIPKHLESILKPIGESNNEFEVTGKIVCDCGTENFTIEIVGDDVDYQKDNVIKVTEIDENYFLIVKVKCNDCGKEHLIFDNDYHGWNGFVCGGDSRNLPRPDTKNWACNKCQHANHSLIVSIHSQGQEDFIEEGGEEFDPNDWVEAFDWITIKTTCKSCGETNDEWISYETM
jgi:ribosomal protein S27E